MGGKQESFSIPPELKSATDLAVASMGYESRSALFRDALSQFLARNGYLPNKSCPNSEVAIKKILGALEKDLVALVIECMERKNRQDKQLRFDPALFPDVADG